MKTGMIRSSRSAIVTRKQCEMKRYLTYHFRTKGVQPRDFVEKAGTISMSALPKVRGAIFHDISLAIVEGASRSDWVELLGQKTQILPPSIVKQQSTLIRRAMIGWELIRGPHWRESYDVVSAEEEWAWMLTPNVVQPLRIDKILRRKSDSALGIFDYKTMGSVSPNWIAKMAMSDQTHTYIQALKERSSEWLLGMCYDGVIIGKLKDGEQRSSFVMGHEKNGKISPKWSAGSTPYDLTDYNDDKWLEWIHEKADELKNLYCTTGWLNPPAAHLLHTKAATGRAEEEFANRVELVETIRDHHGENSHEYESMLGLIEKNPEQCLKFGIGYACPFVQHCWDGMRIEDDEFETRIDHHGDVDVEGE